MPPAAVVVEHLHGCAVVDVISTVLAAITYVVVDGQRGACEGPVSPKEFDRDVFPVGCIPERVDERAGDIDAERVCLDLEDTWVRRLGILRIPSVQPTAFPESEGHACEGL